MNFSVGFKIQPNGLSFGHHCTCLDAFFKPISDNLAFEMLLYETWIHFAI